VTREKPLEKRTRRKRGRKEGRKGALNKGDKMFASLSLNRREAEENEKEAPKAGEGGRRR
jgi:hypothetical protein